MKTASRAKPSSLRRITEECDRELRNRCSELVADAAAGRPLPSAGAWIVDNYAFLHAQLKEVRQAIPPGYEKRLARLSGGLLCGHPRMYLAAFEAIAHSGGAITQEELCAFLERYQRENTIALAEMWAFGPFLKLALVRKVCLAMRHEPLEAPECESAVREAIRDLRNLEAVTWSEVVEGASGVERILREDPAGVYAGMDKRTRDSYRHAVERVANHSRVTEQTVAETAIRMAAESAGEPKSKTAHVGYYLVGKGEDLLKARLGYRRSPLEAARRALMRHPAAFHIGGIAAWTAAILAAMHFALLPAPWWVLALAALPASHAAQSIMNLVVNAVIRPRTLPRMDFSEGVPDDCRAFIVIPALLISRAEVRKLLERLEIHYLANRDPNLYFALLTDYPDAPGQAWARPELGAAEQELVEQCAGGIRSLNRRHGSNGRGPFYLFHRPLEWNESEGVWMGRERKRGKLADFNALLLGEGDAFVRKEGDLAALHSVRYVITLDADTQMPRDVARGLVAAMAHPLSEPEIDPETNTVREGYALMQPRVSVSMESASRSRLARIHSGQTGFDPYAIAVSDVYQDLYGQASFTGKGIYDVAAFHRVAGTRFPENTLLSHDLIEGEHARAGLLTDLEVIDDFPLKYESYSKRKHRWVRGDWQILDWLFPRVREARGDEVVQSRNPLGFLSRWKIFDNLRRSLVEISLLAFLIAGWAVTPVAPLRISLAALALLLAPAYADTILSLLRVPPPRFWAGFIREIGFRLWRAHQDALLNLAFLAHQSLLMADAVVRTLTRRFVTHRRMLEWQTMAQAEAESGHKLDLLKAYLMASPALALAVALGVVSGRADFMTAFFLELWAVAPLVALWVNGRPRRIGASRRDDTAFLRDVSLRTWRYFADHSAPEDNWLAPDNVQEDPPARACRTSPTNLGLQLAANLAAHDLGYLTHQELLAALQRIMDSMERMERSHGHFYNWYDTQTLEPMAPLFVSTVDSGNLAASLVAVKQQFLGAGREPLIDRRTLDGIRDHCLRLRESLPRDARASSIMRPLAALEQQLSYQPVDLFCWESLLSEVASLVEKLHEPALRAAAYLECRVRACPEPRQRDKAGSEVRYWHAALAARVKAAANDLYALAPWLEEPYEVELRLCSRSPEMSELVVLLSQTPKLSELPARYEAITKAIRKRLAGRPLPESTRRVLENLAERLPRSAEEAQRLLNECARRAETASGWIESMDFGFLFDRRRQLLRIGYDASGSRLDESCYDLLASEARTAVFLAIAKGEIPREAWFHLGRRLTLCQGQSTLVSWSGTMFEYLLPALFMKSYDGTLLAGSLEGAVRVQQRYGRRWGVPWGISEAACSLRDHAMIYQYGPFGIPELSSNPALPGDLVIAPYASMLASMIDRPAAAANLKAMEANGWTGRYGFYESVDYARRFGAGHSPAVVRAFMVHHQAMGLIALSNAVLGSPMLERFHRDPLVQSTEYLLQERAPALLDVTDEQQKLRLEFRLPVRVSEAA